MSLPHATMRTRRTPLTPPRAATEVPRTSGHPRERPPTRRCDRLSTPGQLLWAQRRTDVREHGLIYAYCLGGHSCSTLCAHVAASGWGVAIVMPLPLGRYLCGRGHRSTAIVARWGQSCPALGCAGVGPARGSRPGNRSAEHEVRLEARSEDVWRRRRSLVEATGRA